jgi:hypothetical protein
MAKKPAKKAVRKSSAAAKKAAEIRAHTKAINLSRDAVIVTKPDGDARSVTYMVDGKKQVIRRPKVDFSKGGFVDFQNFGGYRVLKLLNVQTYAVLTVLVEDVKKKKGETGTSKEEAQEAYKCIVINQRWW